MKANKVIPERMQQVAFCVVGDSLYSNGSFVKFEDGRIFIASARFGGVESFLHSDICIKFK